MLTHVEQQHEVNLGWHPKAEQLLWRPEIQQRQRSQTGGWKVRDRTTPRPTRRELIAAHAPWLTVRYAC